MRKLLYCKISTRFLLTLLFGAVGSSSCKTSSPMGSAAFDASGGGSSASLSASSVASEKDFQALSVPAGGIISSGRALKFVIDNRKPAAKQVYFVNGNYQIGGKTPDYAKYHYYFAQRVLGIPESLDEFNKVTYFSDQKRYFAGVVQTYRINDETVYGVQFYPQDIIKGANAVLAVRTLLKQFTIPGAKIAFVETGSQQDSSAMESDFAALGVQHLTIERILGNANYLALNKGECWGYLRIFPASQDDITAADIVVFDDLPLDLTVVAGTITKAFQDTNSHVNLKSKERGTPNAVLRDAGPGNALLAPWANSPVHLVVADEKLKIEATTPSVIAQKLKDRFSKPWIPIHWQSDNRLLAYDEMCPTRPADCLGLGAAFGSKAANLGFLANSSVLGRAKTSGTMSNRLGYDLVPFGFGVPLQFYQDFVNEPANRTLKAKIADLISQEKTGSLSASKRVTLVNEVQELFYNGQIPTAEWKAIKDRIAGLLPGVKKIKVRSSANAEDIDGFDGAGLHDSYSAKLKEPDSPSGSCKRTVDSSGDGETKAKMEPRSVACAIKGVYASLWNKRAIEERSFSRIDHATVSMGLSILPAYDYESDVAANSVVVTRVVNSEDVWGYTLSVQKDNNLVTNPDPGTYSEVTVAAIGDPSSPTTLTVTRFAKPTKAGPVLTSPILPKSTLLSLVDIAQAAELAYCRADPHYYGGDCRDVSLDANKEKSVDMEFKYLANHHFVCKQIREFSGK